MGVNISYMGTKREIAPAVVSVIDSARKGIALDVFAGMCSVGEALAPYRQVWTNDVQKFAFEVGTAMFTRGDMPLNRQRISDLHFESYQTHKANLSALFARSLSAESDLLQSQDFDSFEKNYIAFKKEYASEKCEFRPQEHCLFTKIYPDTYFGLNQAIQIDAVIASIDDLASRRCITSDHRRWLTIALGRSMLRTANSTGHFAQFLKPKPASFRTFLRQRRRDIWPEWLDSSDHIAPVGTAEWRMGNKSFNRDCLELIPALCDNDQRPSVIYADPPYTDDQYSRYYHLLETLIFYDYPQVTGAGVYRDNRFRTPFSIKSQAGAALEAMVAAVAKVGADLVLSYPTNGLIYEAGLDPLTILKQHFRSVERCYALSHDHSTFGASKGLAKASVTEQIFLGRL